MPFPAPTKPTPINTLLKWYTERRKGKVVEARREIQRRFDYLDWKDQKKIIIAFLNSCMTDRTWIYKRLYYHWDDSLLPYLLDTIAKSPADINLLSGVIPYVPLDFIEEHYKELSAGVGYYYICRRYIHDKVPFELEESYLLPHEFLQLLIEMGSSIDEQKAMDILFNILHKYATGYNFSIMEMQSYIETNPRHVVPKGKPFTAMDFRYIFILCRRLEDLGKDQVLQDFEEWNETLAAAINDSPEFKELNKATIPDDEYESKRLKIAKQYIYKLMPDKYKSAEDLQPFAGNKAVYEKLTSDYPILDEMVDMFDLNVQETDIPF